ncbi:MAG TPA: hypothetical protein VN765_03390 [Candidatus Acidoferrum sp.]|nr:hypothetical protein [Candidatus Acidoferrum sp.]
MPEPANQSRTFKILAVVFGLAGVVWIVHGFYSPRYIFYPLIGVANLALAYFCKKAST